MEHSHEGSLPRHGISFCMRCERGLRTLLVLVFVFNVADGLLTLLWISANKATEANPIMAHLLAEGPLWFMLGKLSLVMFGLALLWRYKTARLAIPSAVSVFSVYLGIVLYHIHGLHLEYLNPWLL